MAHTVPTDRAYRPGVRILSGRTVVLVAACAAGAAVAATARAGFVPAWSYVPTAQRATLASMTDGSLYLPARTPLFYRYHTGANVKKGVLTVPFTNRVRVRKGVWRWTNATFLWQAQPLPSSKTCVTWMPKSKTLQVSGSKVYWSAAAKGGTAWRCVTDRFGHALVLSASDTGKVADVGLAIVVASGLDVSSRSSSLTKAITVSPSTVHRGRTVLVSGVAGGCAAGDTVTLLSHAFTATHSFAGVPAVYATVGSAGRFSTHARIATARVPGVYTITARCGGGNLGVAAYLTVT
jgi:hypothetical protein